MGRRWNLPRHFVVAAAALVFFALASMTLNDPAPPWNVKTVNATSIAGLPSTPPPQLSTNRAETADIEAMCVRHHNVHRSGNLGHELNAAYDFASLSDLLRAELSEQGTPNLQRHKHVIDQKNSL